MAVPGFMNRVRNHPWDALMLGMEWSTGADEAIRAGDRSSVSECIQKGEQKGDLWYMRLLIIDVMWGLYED